MHTSFACAAGAALCLYGGAPATARQTVAVSAATGGSVLIILPGPVSVMDDPTEWPSGGRYVEPMPPRHVVPSDPFAPFRRTLRPRGDWMFDFSPYRVRGLRLTAGTRYYRRFVLPDNDPGALVGPFATMRIPGGAVALRYGYERYAPVAMLGYDVALGTRLTLGVEGGMMSGRATAMFGSTAGPVGFNAARATDNPVADVIATYRF